MMPLSRRTMLKGLGASLGLPFLDAMVPRAAWAAPETLVRNRMAFVYVPIGAIMQDWTPEKDGATYELSKTLMPLKVVQQDILVLSTFVHDKPRPHGDGGGDHDATRRLSHRHARKSQTDIYIGQSVDTTPPSGSATNEIAVAGAGPSLAGRRKSASGCAYSGHISWKTPIVHGQGQTPPV